MSEKNPLFSGARIAAMAAKAAATNVAAEETVEAANPDAPLAIYTSGNIQNYRLGNNFAFKGGVLKFMRGEEDSLEEFEKLLEQQPPIEKNRIRKIDFDLAAQIIAANQSNNITKGLDQSSNRGPSVEKGLEDAVKNSAATEQKPDGVE